MTTTVVPPQAYTKADLAKAYDWLMKQPTSIQEMANSAETLMGLYRKALLYGASSITPKQSSSTNEFKSELKNLAGQLNQFENNQQQEKPKYSSSVSYQSSKNLPPWAETKKTDTLFNAKVAEQIDSRPNHQEEIQQVNLEASQSPSAKMYQGGFDPSQVPQTANTSSLEGSYSSNNLPSPPKPLNLPDLSAVSSQLDIDANSRAMLGEVRRKLNLSSDAEALRMLISIGYEKAKKIWS
jgi:hypothetical protein